MSVLTVRHLTVYRYSQPVRLGEHRMMFRPRESHDLRLLKSKLHIVPQPVGIRWIHDVFDNSIAIATFDADAVELRFDNAVTLEHVEVMRPGYSIEDYARIYPFEYSADELPNLSRALMHHYRHDQTDRWVRQFTHGNAPQDTMTLLRSITIGIREQFDYIRRDEKGVQTPNETLRSGQGSCRDFAVLMMEAARSLRLAARFVSGYIFSPGPLAAIVGDGATHAWVQIYLPGAGWVDFDPTNSIVGNRNLIRVAVAWDAEQVLPLWGTFEGPASAFLDMAITVTVTEEAAGLHEEAGEAIHPGVLARFI